MRQFSRSLRRFNLFRAYTAALALTWLSILGVFVYASASVQPETATIVAAAALAAIAAGGILYAWREPGP